MLHQGKVMSAPPPAGNTTATPPPLPAAASSASAPAEPVREKNRPAVENRPAPASQPAAPPWPETPRQREREEAVLELEIADGFDGLDLGRLSIN